MPIDYKRYPPNWKETRRRILLRANNTCEFEGCDFKHMQVVFQGKKDNRVEWFHSVEEAKQSCGILHFDKPVKVVLTIAHLDHDETNWNVADDRLMAMCQLHHCRYDAKEKYRRRINKSLT